MKKLYVIVVAFALAVSFSLTCLAKPAPKTKVKAKPKVVDDKKLIWDAVNEDIRKHDPKARLLGEKFIFTLNNKSYVAKEGIYRISIYNGYAKVSNNIFPYEEKDCVHPIYDSSYTILKKINGKWTVIGGTGSDEVFEYPKNDKGLKTFYRKFQVTVECPNGDYNYVDNCK